MNRPPQLDLTPEELAILKKSLSKEDLLALEKNILALVDWDREHKLDAYDPVPKQLEFHKLGINHRERCFQAANRVGKTESGAAEMAMHLTGLYPKWWTGRRFSRPVTAWAAGMTGKSTREVVQEKLCGKAGVVSERGTGYIPKHCVDWADGGLTLSRSAPDAYDTVKVTHHDKNGKPDGISTLGFKSYDQDVGTWMGTGMDVIWLDEEAPADIYYQALTRIGDRNGILYTTFTPENGVTPLLIWFRTPDPQRALVQMTLLEATFYTDEQRERIIAGYPAHQRKMRIYGEPYAGKGAVFPFDEETLKVEQFKPPPHWPLLWGIDFGVAHPFAAALIAWDKDADVVYVMATVRMSDARVIDHVAAMKPLGANVPVAWPQDGTQRREFEGALTPMAKIYASHGAKMQPKWATFPDGSISTEAGIQEISERMTTGRLKIFSHLGEWFEEFRGYHRKDDGLILKERDDLMSATRIAIMAKRGAKAVNAVSATEWWLKSDQKIAKGVDRGSHWGI